MTDKTCAVCGRPADYRVYPHDDPDLMNEGWYTGGLALAVRLRLAWAVLRRRPVEMQKRHPASDTVFPL